MTRKQLADAFNLLAEAAVKVAIELEAIDTPSSEAARPAAVPSASPPARSAAPAAPSDDPTHTHCPAHGKEFKPSKNPGWGAYCTALSDDPAWANDKGYCRITSKNAGEWLRIHGTAA